MSHPSASRRVCSALGHCGCFGSQVSVRTLRHALCVMRDFVDASSG